VAVRRGDVVVHAGGLPVFNDFTPDWPPRKPVSGLTLEDKNGVATIACKGAGENGFSSETITLERAKRLCTIRRSTDKAVRWWFYGPATREGNTLRWASGASLRVVKGELTAYDPKGHNQALITGMGKLPLDDPMPTVYPTATVRPEGEEVVVEVRQRD